MARERQADGPWVINGTTLMPWHDSLIAFTTFTVEVDTVEVDTTVTATGSGPLQGRDGESSNGESSDDEWGEIARPIRKILRKAGEEIYNALKNKGPADFGKGASQTVWKASDGNTRVDVTHKHSNGNVSWELQVNKGCKSKGLNDLAKRLGRNTHSQLTKGTFNPQQSPKEWLKEAIKNAYGSK
jgi:hypothetical protein